MRELVFLLEEPSAREMLKNLLPRILDPSIMPRYISFEGKSDLEKQMLRKMRGYLNPDARFIIMRDQDNIPDCRVLKQALLRRCEDAGKSDVSLVRIACRELESFYLADLTAVKRALGINGLASQQGKAKFRNPDVVQKPSQDLKALTKQCYQKVESSREIGRYLDVENKRSGSFKNLIAGIKRMEQELLGLSA